MVLVRRFEEKDAQALTNLMMEMIGFYGATVDPGLLVAEDVIRQAQQVNIIVAHGDSGLLGFATFTPYFPDGQQYYDPNRLDLVTISEG